MRKTFLLIAVLIIALFIVNLGAAQITSRAVNIKTINVENSNMRSVVWDFETGSQGWTHTNGQAFPAGWAVQASDLQPSYTPPEAGDSSMWIDSDDAGSGATVQDTALSPVVASDPNLTYLKYAVGFNGGSSSWINDLFVGIKTFSGGVWNAPVELKHYANGTTFTGWDSVDVSSYASSDSIQVYFYFDDGGTWGYYAAFDNVTLVAPLPIDIGVASIDSPATSHMLPGETCTPTVTVKNFGTSPETDFWTYYEIRDSSNSIVYAESVQINTPDTIAPESTMQIVMPDNFTSSIGVYNITAYTVLAGDLVPSNDTLNMTLSCSYMGWNNEDATGSYAVQWAQSCVGGGKLWVVGGLDTGSVLSSEFRSYEPGVGWTTLTPIPTSSFGGACAFINGKIYVVGGFDASFAAVNRVAIYDTTTGTWSTGTVSPPDTLRGGVGGAVVNGKMYIVGGSKSSSFPTDCPTLEYDPAADTTGGSPWTMKTACPRGDSGLILGAPFMPFNGSPYVFVGGDYRGNSSTYGYYYYEPDADTTGGTPWTTIAQPPADVGGMWPAMDHDGTYLYLFGGDPAGGWVTPYSDKLFYWDINTDTWIDANASMSSAYEPSASGIIGNKLYSFGGTIGSGPIDPPPFEWTYLATYQGIANKKIANEKNSSILLKNMPNPMIGKTNIDYQVGINGRVKLAIYSLSGRVVKTLVDGTKKAGIYKAVWNGRDDTGNRVVAGIYICKLVNGGKMISKKITVIK